MAPLLLLAAGCPFVRYYDDRDLDVRCGGRTVIGVVPPTARSVVGVTPAEVVASVNAPPIRPDTLRGEGVDLPAWMSLVLTPTADAVDYVDTSGMDLRGRCPQGQYLEIPGKLEVLIVVDAARTISAPVDVFAWPHGPQRSDWDLWSRPTTSIDTPEWLRATAEVGADMDTDPDYTVHLYPKVHGTWDRPEVRFSRGRGPNRPTEPWLVWSPSPETPSTPPEAPSTPPEAPSTPDPRR